MSQLAPSGIWWAAAVFAAGGAAGALGLSVVMDRDRGSESSLEERGAADPTSQGPALEDPAEAARSEIDREALRAALAELLAEERRVASEPEPSDREGQPEVAPEQEGVSAAEVLVRLEQAYQAKLLEQAEREVVVASVDEPDGSDEAAPPAPSQALAAVDPPPTARRRARYEAPDPEEEGEAAPSRAVAMAPSAAPSVQIDNVYVQQGDVHQGDIHQVDARQLAQYQQVLMYSFATGAGAAPPRQPTPGRQPPASGSFIRPSPLEKPLPSAHDRSPWSPIDYSRHHNPWGPTFGRRP